MIDWKKLQELYPEEWAAARETHSFAESEYGKKRRKELEEIVATSKDDMVATINSGMEGSIETARAAAALIEGINLAIGVLYQNDLLTAEGLLASEEMHYA